MSLSRGGPAGPQTVRRSRLCASPPSIPTRVSTRDCAAPVMGHTPASEKTTIAIVALLPNNRLIQKMNSEIARASSKHSMEGPGSEV